VSRPAAGRFDGTLVLPGDPDWEDARVGRVFNARKPARQPAAVLRARTERDLVEAVRLARERGWQVSVRAGGHSWAAWSVRDDALLVDLGDYRDIAYDPQTRIVSVTPAVRGGTELRPYLAERGRFFAGGHCPTVGLGGFLLQGGQGYNARGWGWAAESIVAVDVVTADGELVRADADRHEDLYWAARGAGPGFFGLISRFHLRTRPLPRVAAETVRLYDLADFAAVMTWLQRIHGTVSPDVEIVAVSTTPDEPLPGHPGGHVLAVTGLALVDTMAAAEAALAPLATCPVRPLLTVPVVPSSLELHAERQLLANPEGCRYVVDNAWLTGTPAEVVPLITPLFTGLPTARSFVIWFSMAPLRELPDMAFSLQTEIYCSAYLVYDDPGQDARHRRWLTDRMRELQPITAGQYLGDADHTARQVRFMGAEQFARLLAIRAKRDPDGLFAGYLTAADAPLNTNPWEA